MTRQTPPGAHEDAIDAPKVPGDLSPAAEAWWRYTATTWRLDAHHLGLLELAARAWDRAEEARAEIDAAGAYYVDRFGQPKAHPALRVEIESRRQYAALVRELCLDDNPPPPAPRRPSKWQI
jgi:phage terminase small subunit